MAKGAKGKKKQQPKGNGLPRKPRRAMPTVRSMLDSQAIAYRSLLLDPCAANLAHPVYGGGAGGILCRFTSTIVVGNSAGETGFIYHWTPGTMTTGQDEIVVTGFSNPGTATVAVGILGAPGKDYLPTNAMSFRCVSACATLTYTGSELNRSGSVWYGQTTGQLCNIGVSYVGIDMPKSLPRNIRTPDQSVDILWRPGATDYDYVVPTDPFSENPPQKDDRGSITVVATGLPAATGIQIRMTAVYEYQPRYNTGMTVTTTARSTSNNTLNQILNSIPDNSWSRIGSAAMALGGSIMRRAGTDMISTGFNYAARMAPMMLAL